MGGGVFLGGRANCGGECVVQSAGAELEARPANGAAAKQATWLVGGRGGGNPRRAALPTCSGAGSLLRCAAMGRPWAGPGAASVQLLAAVCRMCAAACAGRSTHGLHGMWQVMWTAVGGQPIRADAPRPEWHGGRGGRPTGQCHTQLRNHRCTTYITASPLYSGHHTYTYMRAVATPKTPGRTPSSPPFRAAPAAESHTRRP